VKDQDEAACRGGIDILSGLLKVYLDKSYCLNCILGAI
jgi:hypothetical protein